MLHIHKKSMIRAVIIMMALFICVTFMSCPAHNEHDIGYDTYVDVAPHIEMVSDEQRVVTVQDMQSQYDSFIPTDNNKIYTHDDLIMFAKVLYKECVGVRSVTEQACVAWTICNRYDAGYGTLTAIITAPNAYAYYEDTPVDAELMVLAEDVLDRWCAERSGMLDIGRTIPSDYLYFNGDGAHNYFRNTFKDTGNYWDYSLKSPYYS